LYLNLFLLLFINTAMRLASGVYPLLNCRAVNLEVAAIVERAVNVCVTCFIARLFAVLLCACVSVRVTMQGLLLELYSTTFQQILRNRDTDTFTVTDTDTCDVVYGN